ncbi:hypothetical protein J7K27_09955 [Candidatus Bathyarchaeota archaeon]|nr:hypothetical protein [Candidatus Bathyarchaeota archaeon]
MGLNETRKDLMVLGFDDHALARPVLGSYSWRCVEINGKYAKLQVEVNVTVLERLEPTESKWGGVTYTGREFFERAEKGDLSFIRRIPIEQAKEKIVLINGSKYGGEYYVKIKAPVHIYKKLMVTVKLDTLELVDENGKPWGKWIMWINPLNYPLTNYTLERFVMNWLNKTLDLYVGYNNGTLGPTIDTVLGRFEKYFVASHPPIENEFLLELGLTLSSPSITLTYAYEPRTGIFLQTLTKEYVDDILTQELGIILADGPFTLSETNVSIKQDSGFDFSPFIPCLAVATISGIIVGAYLIKKKRRSPQ